MKIISLKESISIEHVLLKEILIPVRVYKIPILIRTNELNFLEETIFKLKNVDRNLDIKDITNLLGLEGKEDLVKFILDKLNSIKEINKEDNEEVFFFYQEMITGKALNVITKQIDNFDYVQNERWSNIENIKIIEYEKDSKKNVAFSFKYNKKIPYLTQEYLNTIIIKNNLNNNYSSEYIRKIPTTQISNINLNDYEEMLLNVKIFIPVNNKSIILVTDGFNGGFSPLLSKIIYEYHRPFVLYLKESVTIEDISNRNRNNIILPFENKINDYFEIKNLIRNIEIDYKNYLDENDSFVKIKLKKRILINLFDVLEKIFLELSKDLKYVEFITRENIISILKQNNFLVKEKMNIFKISNKNNIQKYLSLSIFHRKEEINDLHKKTFIFLEKLLNYRNDLKHSSDINVEDVDIKKFIDITYKIISKILKIELTEKEEQSSLKLHCDKELQFNAAVDIEKEFIEVLDKIDDYIKDKLIDINFTIEEINYTYDIIKYAINNIYSLFEYLFKKYEIVDKNKILKKYPNLPKELKSVKIEKSLGRYYLNYLYFNSNDEKLTNFISYVIHLRGHGNNCINISKDELKSLKEKTFTYVKQILKERK